MRLPTPLLRRDTDVHKNHFGHVFILAGSARMLGAAALSALSAMRSGAGLVTLAVAKSLNLTAQEKVTNVVMTLPLAEESPGIISAKAYSQIRAMYPKFQSFAVGPGLDLTAGVKKNVFAIIKDCPHPLVVDAAALTLLSEDVKLLQKAKGPRILTPHGGEMKQLTPLTQSRIESNRMEITKRFAKTFGCTILLKGPRTIVADPSGKSYINRTGNAGMATAGSGDVLTGMIAAFLAQGIAPFEAAKTGCYLHGKAGDLAAKRHSKTSMIASDIIESIGEAIKNESK